MKKLVKSTYLWYRNSGNYVEFLIPVAETVSGILTSRIQIPGILNSRGGNLFCLEFGAYKVPQVRQKPLERSS